MAETSGPRCSGSISRVRLEADVPWTRNSYSAKPSRSTSATAMVVASGPKVASSRLTPSAVSRLLSSWPNLSLDRRPRNEVGTPRRASAIAVLKGPPPGAARCVPSPLWIMSISASPQTTMTDASRQVRRDDGDPRLQEVGQQDVVEPEQGDALMQSHPSQCTKGADRNQVLTSQERGGRIRLLKQLTRRRLRFFDSM